MELLRIPLINASEDELEVRLVSVTDGQRVAVGDVICVIESTKAAMELEAPVAGYVRQLAVKHGTRARVGDPVCAITATADEPLDAPPRGTLAAFALPAGERIPDVTEVDRPLGPSSGSAPVEATRRARELAAARGIDLATLGVTGIVRAEHVEQALQAGARASEKVRGSERPEVAADRIVVLGAGGHARAVVDLIRTSRPDLQIVGALDDGPAPPDEVLGVPVIGSSQRLAKLRERGVVYAALGVGAVRDNAVRARLFARLRDAGYEVPSLVHPRAVVEPSARMGCGNQVFAGAVVGANVRLGENTIVNSNAVLSHDCVVDSHAHVAPGALLAGGVRVGQCAVIGMGVTVYLGVRIGEHVVIQNGTHVFRDRLERVAEPALRS